MSGVRTAVISDDEEGMRLDRWFHARYPALAHGALHKLLRKGEVRVDGGRAKANQRVVPGQEIRIPPTVQDGPAEARKPAQPSDADTRFIADMTLYEDKDIIVLNKPAGLAVQGGTKTSKHIDGILARMGEGDLRPRLVHRLDRDTSGVLVVARRRQIAARLGQAFATRSVRKIYWAVSGGVPDPRQGKIDLPLIKAPGGGGDRVRPAQKGEEGAQHAVTHFTVNDNALTTAAWITLKPVTGRQHQLRAHMAAVGTPILGDNKYGGDALVPGVLDNRLHLHARRVMFRHPREDRMVDVTAPLPDHMAKTFSFFGFDVNAARGDDDALA